MLFSASQTCERANGEKIQKRTRLILNTMKTSMCGLKVTNLGLLFVCLGSSQSLLLKFFCLPLVCQSRPFADTESRPGIWLGFGWGLFSVRVGSGWYCTLSTLSLPSSPGPDRWYQTHSGRSGSSHQSTESCSEIHIKMCYLLSYEIILWILKFGWVLRSCKTLQTLPFVMYQGTQSFVVLQLGTRELPTHWFLLKCQNLQGDTCTYSLRYHYFFSQFLLGLLFIYVRVYTTIL